MSNDNSYEHFGSSTITNINNRAFGTKMINGNRYIICDLTSYYDDEYGTSYVENKLMDQIVKLCKEYEELEKENLNIQGQISKDAYNNFKQGIEDLKEKNKHLQDELDDYYEYSPYTSDNSNENIDILIGLNNKIDELRKENKILYNDLTNSDVLKNLRIKYDKLEEEHKKSNGVLVNETHSKYLLVCEENNKLKEEIEKLYRDLNNSKAIIFFKEKYDILETKFELLTNNTVNKRDYDELNKNYNDLRDKLKKITDTK